MTKKPGKFFKLFNNKKTDELKPVSMQKVSISNTQESGAIGYRKKKKDKKQRLGAVINVSESESTPLEETPINDKRVDKSSKPNKESVNKKSKKDKIKDKNNDFITRQDAKRTGIKSEPAATRFTVPKKNSFANLNPLHLFKKKEKSRHTAAFEFAENKRWSGKRGKRRKRMLMYASTGLLVVIVLLVVVLVPFGEAADTDIAAREPVQAEAALEETEQRNAAPMEAALAESADEIIEAAPSESASAELSGQPTQTAAQTSTPIPTTEPDPTPIPINMDDFVAEFMVEADLYYNDVGYSSNHYEYTEEEKYMLAQLIDGEARGESMEGKVAVGNVVMNRVFARKFGSSIKSVITAPGQFTGYSSSRKPSSSCKTAAAKVLDFEVWVVPQNTYYFNSHKPAGVDWSSHRYFTRIGGHNFYTHSYSGRSRIDDPPPRLYERTFKWPQYGCKPEKRVKRIQLMLNSLGYDVKADSYFGMDTVDAIKEFQDKKGLEVDGICGPTTIEELIRTYGADKYYKEIYL